MTIYIPSLSDQAWVVDDNKILEYLISYYILTDSMQTLIFQDNLINLPETYYKYINDPVGMASGIKSDLDKLLSRFFSVVEVNTNVKKIDDKWYAILLYVSVITKDYNKIELSKIVKISTTKLRKIINMNNYGDGMSYLNQL